MKKYLLLAALLCSNIYALTAKEFAQQQNKEFNAYKTREESEFKEYKKAQLEAFNVYKKELSVFWKEPKLSSKKKWVEYTQDKKTRTDVDFEKNTITLETLAASQKEAEQKLKLALAKVVTVDTKTVQKTDPLQKRLRKIRKPRGMVDATVKAEPILATVIFQKKPTKKTLKKYVQKHINPKYIKVKKTSQIKYAKVYSIQVKLPKDTTLKRSRIYLNDIKKHAKKQELPISLIFAIMHTESSFNPRARSYIPAYGLMQIVPKTAGIDSYNYLYKKKKLVTSTYLYNSNNNIRMGSAYLHILYYSYLKKIQNPQSRLYCTIAAYNTGAGNIAYAFTKKYNMTKAAPLINRLSPQQVYAKLMKDLRWEEPKKYLKNVSKRMSAYHKVYGS